MPLQVKAPIPDSTAEGHPTVIEKRRFTRSTVVINVDIQILGATAYKGAARDISQGGICVDIFGDAPPKQGAKAHMDFLIWTGKENIQRRLSGVVVRSSSASIALMFDDEPKRTEATVQEILHYQQFERRHKSRGAS